VTLGRPEGVARTIVSGHGREALARLVAVVRYRDGSVACRWQTVPGMEAWDTKDCDMMTSSPSPSRD